MEGILSLSFLTLPQPCSSLKRVLRFFVVQHLWTAENHYHLPKTKAIEIHQGPRRRPTAVYDG